VVGEEQRVQAQALTDAVLEGAGLCSSRAAILRHQILVSARHCFFGEEVDLGSEKVEIDF
jgi:hypothetical protein